MFKPILTFLFFCLFSTEVYSGEVENRLRPLWRELIISLVPAADPIVIDCAFTDIALRYSEPHRHYHTLEHVDDLLNVINNRSSCSDLTLSNVYLAVWFHDVIYDPKLSDNETKSALYARDLLFLLGLESTIVDEVQRLIELTAGHSASPHDICGAILIDADLSILGSDRERYARYAHQIQLEYGHLSNQEYRVGRLAFLQAIMNRPRLFVTDYFYKTYEVRAQENLKWEMGQKLGPVPA